MRMFGSTFAGLAIAMMLGMSTAADAQTVRWKSYLHPENQTMKEFHDIYLAGIRDGLISYGVATHDKTTMCLPQTTVLTTEQLDGIMKRWAETQTANPNLDILPIGLIAMAALKKEYPCQ